MPRRLRLFTAFGLTIVLVPLLVSCGKHQRKQGSAPKSAPKEPAATSPPVGQREALTEQQRDVLQQIEKAGGTFDGNGKVPPSSIDLASDRVFADDALIRSLANFPGLERLRLAMVDASGDAFKSLQSLPELTHLFLQGASLDNQQLLAIVEATPKLEHLALRRVKGISDAFLPALADRSSPRTLALIEIDGITGKTLPELANLHSLRSLDLRNCGNLQIDDLEQLVRLDKLTELKVGGSAINDEALSVIASHPSVSSLAIEDAEVSAECLKCLVAEPRFAKRLRSLAFARCFGVSDGTLATVVEFPNLQTLSLRDILVTGSFIEQLQGTDSSPPPLKTLIVINGFLGDDSITALPDVFPNLARLDLRGNGNVTDASLPAFEKLGDLRELRLEETGVSDSP
ncbi:MAG: hypothetical protein ACODAD_12415 [Planctomycetota bacterium]